MNNKSPEIGRGLSNEQILTPVLREVSIIPYNNAATIFERSGLEPDPRFGGSCIFKLRHLEDMLPPNSIHYITSQAKDHGGVTHYASLFQNDKTYYYIDPFLWQKEPLPLDGYNRQAVATFSNDWEIIEEAYEPEKLLSISLRTKRTLNLPEKTMITHVYDLTAKTLSIPTGNNLIIRPDLPSFLLQVPSPDGIFFYKVWYTKGNSATNMLGFINDIWIHNSETGENLKVAKNSSDINLRKKTISDVEGLLCTTESELCNYFDTAHRLELEL